MHRVLLVEDGKGSYLLPVVRSFGRAGWEVGLGNPTKTSRAGGSRFVGRRHLVPPPEAGLEPFGAAVQAAIDDGGYDIVFGGDDVEVLALSALRDELGACVPYPPHEAVVRSIDKLELTRAAEAVGLGVPAVGTGRYPAVVKARLHWTPGAVTDVDRHLPAIAADERAAGEAVDRIEASGGRAIVQEQVTGDLMALTVLLGADGTVRATVQQRALLSTVRGTSARAVTVPVDEALLERVTALVGSLGWTGLANLQFLDAAGRGPLLIDLNGRFYGSVGLAMAAGVDLPVLWARSAFGEELPVVTAEVGVRYQSLLEDLERAPSAALSSLAFGARATHSTLALDDPVPALRWALSLAALSSRAAWRRTARPLRPGRGGGRRSSPS